MTAGYAHTKQPKECKLLVKRGKASKRNWISLQEQVGFWQPKLERTQFVLSCDVYDVEIWQREIKDHKCNWENVK